MLQKGFAQAQTHCLQLTAPAFFTSHLFHTAFPREPSLLPGVKETSDEDASSQALRREEQHSIPCAPGLRHCSISTSQDWGCCSIPCAPEPRHCSIPCAPGPGTLQHLHIPGSGTLQHPLCPRTKALSLPACSASTPALSSPPLASVPLQCPCCATLPNSFPSSLVTALGRHWTPRPPCPQGSPAVGPGSRVPAGARYRLPGRVPLAQWPSRLTWLTPIHPVWHSSALNHAFLPQQMVYSTFRLWGPKY